MERLRNEIAEISHVVPYITVLIFFPWTCFWILVKYKALSQQVEKLKELISEGVPHNNKNQSGRIRKTPKSPQVTTRCMRNRSRQTEDMVETDTVSPTRSMTKHSRQTEDIMETDVVSPHIILAYVTYQQR
ncbi:unnamed protein product [Brassica oleracea var. botrytis]|uniref:Uncharacterized protein n=3 Tax=Brassica TaxID=3705 RepID=A0A0D3ASF7_BRAOL|nr:unnamed protein product [Brassica napus]VDD24136.1 unnamed protein product [Brassica oleracea]